MLSQHGPLSGLFQNTCVLVAIAYLLSRDPLLTRLLDRSRPPSDVVELGFLFGLIGAVELLLPGNGRPFAPASLVAGFAGYAGGLPVGLLSSALMLALMAVDPLFDSGRLPPGLPAATVVGAAATGAAVAWIWHRVWKAAPRDPAAPLPLLLSGSLVAGVCAALLPACWGRLAAAGQTTPAVQVLANGLGCGLLTAILRDAYERRETLERRLRAERELAALRLSQLAQLQARLHPHFLFNVLAAVAGLCRIDAGRAERAIEDLSALLRRFLRSPAESLVPLGEELQAVRAYLALERLRLADRLQIVEEPLPDEILALPVPRFCLQILVENAVQHGVAPTGRPGRVRIRARRRIEWLLLVVEDNGAGVPCPIRPRVPSGDEPPPHGLDLLAARLRLAYGAAARLRLFSAAGRGTLGVLRLPV